MRHGVTWGVAEPLRRSHVPFGQVAIAEGEGGWRLRRQVTPSVWLLPFRERKVPGRDRGGRGRGKTRTVADQSFRPKPPQQRQTLSSGHRGRRVTQPCPSAIILKACVRHAVGVTPRKRGCGRPPGALAHLGPALASLAQPSKGWR